MSGRVRQESWGLNVKTPVMSHTVLSMNLKATSSNLFYWCLMKQKFRKKDSISWLLFFLKILEIKEKLEYFHPCQYPEMINSCIVLSFLYILILKDSMVFASKNRNVHNIYCFNIKFLGFIGEKWMDRFISLNYQAAGIKSASWLFLSPVFLIYGSYRSRFSGCSSRDFSSRV